MHAVVDIGWAREYGIYCKCGEIGNLLLWVHELQLHHVKAMLFITATNIPQAYAFPQVCFWL